MKSRKPAAKLNRPLHSSVTMTEPHLRAIIALRDFLYSTDVGKIIPTTSAVIHTATRYAAEMLSNRQERDRIRSMYTHIQGEDRRRRK